MPLLTSFPLPPPPLPWPARLRPPPHTQNVCYLLIQSAAARLDVVRLAAHQAVFSVWNLMAWTVTPFEQSAMTYLPASKGWRRGAGVQLLVALSVAVGAGVGAALALAIGLAPQLLARDPATWQHMTGVAPLAGLTMVLVGVDVVCSGARGGGGRGSVERGKGEAGNGTPGRAAG